MVPPTLRPTAVASHLACSIWRDVDSQPVASDIESCLHSFAHACLTSLVDALFALGASSHQSLYYILTPSVLDRLLALLAGMSYARMGRGVGHRWSYWACFGDRQLPLGPGARAPPPRA